MSGTFLRRHDEVRGTQVKLEVQSYEVIFVMEPKLDQYSTSYSLNHCRDSDYPSLKVLMQIYQNGQKSLAFQDEFFIDKKKMVETEMPDLSAIFGTGQEHGRTMDLENLVYVLNMLNREEPKYSV